MRINHSHHNHPNTPTARAGCRKAMAKMDTSEWLAMLKPAPTNA